MNNGVMGMAICNDRRWPETYRVMSLEAELIMLGYNTPDVNTSAPEPNHLRMFHNHLTMQANAYMNSAYVVGVAKAGIEDGCMLIGGSCIIQPSGEIVSLASTLEDELITYSCDLDLANMGKQTVFNFAATAEWSITASSRARPGWNCRPICRTRRSKRPPQEGSHQSPMRAPQGSATGKCCWEDMR